MFTQCLILDNDGPRITELGVLNKISDSEITKYHTSGMSKYVQHKIVSTIRYNKLIGAILFVLNVVSIQ